jgi:type IV pilus modification protein PilV
MSTLNSPQQRRLRSTTRQTGFGLLEVMVSIFLLGMTLLGAVALQFATVKEQRSSQFVNRAAIAASEIAERMRANRAGIENLATLQYVSVKTTYVTALPLIEASLSEAETCTTAAPCTTPTATAANDVVLWQQFIAQHMPRGQSAAFLLMPTASTAGNALARTIVIAWVEPVVDKKADGTPVLVTSAGSKPTSGCPTSIDAPDGVRCYTQTFVL